MCTVFNNKSYCVMHTIMAQTNFLAAPAVVPLHGDIFSPCIVQLSCLGRSDEGDFCLDRGAVVTLQPAPFLPSPWHKARGQGSRRGAVKVKGLSLSEGSRSHQSGASSTHTSCPVGFFSSPPLFLIPPNGPGKKEKEGEKTPDSS